MVKGFVLLTAVCFLGTTINAQDYNVNSIPDSLKQNTHAVKRLEELRVIIKSNNTVIIKHKYAITVLDEQGDGFAEYSNTYSMLEELSNIDGHLFDANGKKLKSVKKKDIEDVPTSDGFSLMQDDRIKRHNFHHRQYPYTVEYYDEQESKGTYFLPSWRPVEGEDFSVQQSSFIVETPIGYGLRYKLYNLQKLPDVVNAQVSSYRWSLANTKSISHESFELPFKERAPMIYIAASDFSLGSYSGNMTSWLSLGRFNASMNKGRDVLPEKIIQEIHRLTDTVSDKWEKVRKIYQYLQSNTRYISIQLGIGGWQPFDAKYVATNRYGDCKALTNYMVSLLKEIGIKANYVLVTAGEGDKGLAEDFPSPYFNHVICCVPDGKDTLWLECTSQTKQPGFMGSFTGDRKVLLIDDDGGHVVNTPIYKVEDNLQLRKINASIDEAGNLTADVNTFASCIQQELMHSLMYESTKEQRDRYLNNVLGLPTYEVDKSVYKAIPGNLPAINEYLHVKATNYATVSGKRMFVLPNLFNRSRVKLSDDIERKTPIRFSEAYKDIDTIQITVPKGYVAESTPKNVLIQSQFGDYQIQYTIAENVISVMRLRIGNKQDFPPSEYPSLVKYYEEIYKADHARIVFVKNDN